jgi:hypothetical protein
MRLPSYAAGGTRHCCFPLQFSPFGNPLSRFPLSKLNPPKGANRRGHQHGGFPVRRTERGPHFPAPLVCAARRRPSGCRMPLRRFAKPPNAPNLWGLRSGLRRLAQLTRLRPSMVFASLTCRRHPPLRLLPPSLGGRRVRFATAPRSRARCAPAKQGWGFAPHPVFRARLPHRESFTNLDQRLHPLDCPKSPGGRSGARVPLRAFRAAPAGRSGLRPHWGRAYGAPWKNSHQSLNTHTSTPLTTPP